VLIKFIPRGPFAQTLVEPTRAKQFWPSMSYNRLFLWIIHSINGLLLVLITGIWMCKWAIFLYTASAPLLLFCSTLDLKTLKLSKSILKSADQGFAGSCTGREDGGSTAAPGELHVVFCKWIVGPPRKWTVTYGVIGFDPWTHKEFVIYTKN